MTAIEIKYSTFKDIDSINDESLLQKLSALIKGMIVVPKISFAEHAETADIPEFVRNISVKTTLPEELDVKKFF